MLRKSRLCLVITAPSSAKADNSGTGVTPARPVASIKETVFQVFLAQE
jgi:hypothetical protein